MRKTGRKPVVVLNSRHEKRGNYYSIRLNYCNYDNPTRHAGKNEESEEVRRS